MPEAGKALNDKEVVNRVQTRAGALRSERQTWENHWQEVTNYTVPRKDDINYARHPGEKRSKRVYESTAILSNEFLSGALHSMLTNPQSKWFGLSTGDKELDSRTDVRDWLERSVNRIHAVLNNSNFQTEIHEVYLDLGSIGTGVMSIEEDDDSIVRFYSRHIREMLIAENSKSQVDTVYREFEMSAINLKTEFGEDKLSEDVKRSLKENPHKTHKVVHAVEPNRKEIAGVADRFDYTSIYVLPDDGKVLRRSGFNEFPYVVPRWTKTTNEVYGRSPAMKALADIKMINQMMKTTIEAAQKSVDPPLMVPDDGFVLPVKTYPGGLNYRRASTQERIEPFANQNQVDFGFQMIEMIRQKIREHFFVDQMQLQRQQQMTATEVLQRTEEQMRLLGPMLGRQQHELLRPLVDRVWGIMVRKDQLPEDMPEDLEGRELEVEYVSLAAKAQRASEGQNFMRTMEMIGPVMQMRPEAVDNFDGDEAIRYLSEITGLPARVMREERAVEELREQRQQQQQQMQQMDQERHESEVARNVAPLQRGNNQEG